MTKKETILKAIATVNGKEVNGVYEMTMTQFSQLDAELGNSGIGYAFCNNKKDNTLKAVYDQSKKNRYVVIKIVEEVKKAKKVKKVKKTATPNEGAKVAHKPVNSNYTIEYTTAKGTKKTNTSITTCKEIKEFIKELKKQKVVTLSIYKASGEPTRKSAWI